MSIGMEPTRKQGADQAMQLRRSASARDGHSRMAGVVGQPSLPEDESGAAGRLECHWQRDQLPEAIRELVLDGQGGG